MTLQVTITKKGDALVSCPRMDEEVNIMHACQKCKWLSVRTLETVRCRWTPLKEDIDSGRRRYEAS